MQWALVFLLVAVGSGSCDVVQRGLFDGIKNQINGVKETVSSAKDKVSQTASQAVNGVQDTVNKITEEAKEKIESNINKVTGQFKDGIAMATSLFEALKNLNICSCQDKKCLCCAELKLSKSKVCLTITFSPETFEVGFGMTLDEYTLVEGTISGKDPKPLCAPLPAFPAVALCVRAYDLGLESDGLRACFQIEAKGFGKNLASVSLSCFKVSRKNISILPPRKAPEEGVLNIDANKVISPIIDINRSINLPFK